MISTCPAGGKGRGILRKHKAQLSGQVFLHSKWDTGTKMGRFGSCIQQNSRLAIESLLAKQLYISSFYNAPWRSIALGWLICFVLFPCYQSTRLQAGKLLGCVRFYPKISGKIGWTLQNPGEREKGQRGEGYCQPLHNKFWQQWHLTPYL